MIANMNTNTNARSRKSVAHRQHVTERSSHVGQANRATTFTDRRKQANRDACRRRNWNENN